MHSSPTSLLDKPRSYRDVIDQANERYADAKKRELAASALGQEAEKERAILDAWDAMGDRQAARTEAAEGLISLLRIAAEEMPVQLSTALENVLFVRQHAEAIAELEQRRKGVADERAR